MGAYVELYDRLRKASWRPELDVQVRRDKNGVLVEVAAYRMMATKRQRSAVGEWMTDLESAAVSFRRTLLRHGDREHRESIE